MIEKISSDQLHFSKRLEKVDKMAILLIVKVIIMSKLERPVQDATFEVLDKLCSNFQDMFF